MIDVPILAAVIAAAGAIVAAVIGHSISSRRKKGEPADARTLLALEAAKLVVEMHAQALMTVKTGHSHDLRLKNQSLKQLQNQLEKCNETVANLINRQS